MGDDQSSPQAVPSQPQDETPETTRLLDASGRDVTDETIRPISGTGPAPLDLPDPAEVFARLSAQVQPKNVDVPTTSDQAAPTVTLDADVPTTPIPVAEPVAAPSFAPVVTPPVVAPIPSVAAPIPSVTTAPVPTTPIPDVAPTAPIPTAPIPTVTPFAPAVTPDPEPVADEATQQLDQDTRDRLLGNVAPVADDGEVPPLTRHDNDKFVGSFGLFWLRLITAAVLGIHAVQMLIHDSAVQTWLGTIGVDVPEPQIVAWALPILLLLVAVLLVIGLLTRTAAVIVVLYAAALLAFVDWGAGSVFANAPAQGGFIGDFDLLLAGVGIGLAFLGAGGWSFDGHRRLVKARRKLYN